MNLGTERNNGVDHNPTFGPISTLDQLVSEAWGIGQAMDLSGIGYGQIHWGNRVDVIDSPFPYYHFLAGLIHCLKATKVVEVGTHHGGSAQAMAAALTAVAGAKIVTFDVTPEGSLLLEGHPIIRAYNLEANTEAAYEACLAEFGEAKVDLAYIDASHSFWPTLMNYLICVEVLQADVVVLDDITLNDGMRRLWHLIRQRHPNDSIDATEVHPEIRQAGPDTAPGFGLVRLRGRAGSALGSRTSHRDNH